jgi:CheY-like chemotaxis protein
VAHRYFQSVLKPQKQTLLIVEDDDDQRLFFKLAFESLGTQYVVQALASGEEAIAYLKGESKYRDRTKFEFPSYVITDLKMPRGDGFHVLEFIKKNPALSLIPVVMLSSSEDADDVRHAYLLGASSYMVKPIGVRAMRALLKKIHEYWGECEVPEVDESGYAVDTDSRGKLGARYTKPKRER